MTRIDEKSIKDLLKVRADTKYAVTKVTDGHLLHSQWFAFFFTPSEIEVCDHGAPVDLATLLTWRELAEPAGAVFKKGMPMMSKDPGEPEEPLVQFRTPDPKIVAYMKAPVFEWIQTTFNDPEFWVRGVDQVVAIKQDGKLIGGVGPTRLRVESPAARRSGT